jgi:hypothetical protein
LQYLKLKRDQTPVISETSESLSWIDLISPSPQLVLRYKELLWQIVHLSHCHVSIFGELYGSWSSQDSPAAVTEEELARHLHLKELDERPYKFVAGSAYDGWAKHMCSYLRKTEAQYSFILLGVQAGNL